MSEPTSSDGAEAQLLKDESDGLEQEVINRENAAADEADSSGTDSSAVTAEHLGTGIRHLGRKIWGWTVRQCTEPVLRQLGLLPNILEGVHAQGAVSSDTVMLADSKGAHKFWSTQPVLDFVPEVTLNTQSRFLCNVDRCTFERLATALNFAICTVSATTDGDHADEDDSKEGPIEPDKDASEVRATPYPLPPGFEWTEVDVDDEAQLKELYELLSFNYVEDDDCMFRFDYSAEFLHWALQPPGWLKSWHPGVRVSASKRLVAFISAIPADMRIYGRHQRLVEINFLCVHKRLRSKRLAPVLIREITRRVHQQRIFQATYTAGLKLPRPVSVAQYFHRSLNPKKLIESGFSHLPRNSTMARTIKLYRLPEEPSVPGFREMRREDVSACHKLLQQQLAKYHMAPHFNKNETLHWFMPRSKVIYSYVVADRDTGRVTDLVSFYALPSTVINHPIHKTILAAYLFFYASTVTPLKDLIHDAMVMARKHDFDVFNCLDLMDNRQFMTDLKFGPGDGFLNYYLYNWRCKAMESDKLGLVMV